MQPVSNQFLKSQLKTIKNQLLNKIKIFFNFFKKSKLENKSNIEAQIMTKHPIGRTSEDIPKNNPAKNVFLFLKTGGSLLQKNKSSSLKKKI